MGWDENPGVGWYFFTTGCYREIDSLVLLPFFEKEHYNTSSSCMMIRRMNINPLTAGRKRKKCLRCRCWEMRREGQVVRSSIFFLKNKEILREDLSLFRQSWEGSLIFLPSSSSLFSFSSSSTIIKRISRSIFLFFIIVIFFSFHLILFSFCFLLFSSSSILQLFIFLSILKDQQTLVSSNDCNKRDTKRRTTGGGQGVMQNKEMRESNGHEETSEHEENFTCPDVCMMSKRLLHSSLFLLLNQGVETIGNRLMFMHDTHHSESKTPVFIIIMFDVQFFSSGSIELTSVVSDDLLETLELLNVVTLTFLLFTMILISGKDLIPKSALYLINFPAFQSETWVIFKKMSSSPFFQVCVIAVSQMRRFVLFSLDWSLVTLKNHKGA